MSDFHALTIQRIVKVASKAVAISFDLPASLSDKYNFVPGQYITLKTQIDGKEVRRAYSICSVPQKEPLTVAVKEIPNGTFSAYANQQLQVGGSLEVAEPEGRFQLIAEEGKSYLAFAAGSGITPILSMIKAVLSSTQTSRFVLVYGNKSPDDTMFLDTLQKLQTDYPERFFIQWIFSQTQTTDSLFGRIEASIVNLIVKNKYKDTDFAGYYLCGPEAMIDEVRNTLIEQKIAKDKIHFELFTSAASTPDSAPSKGMTQLTILLDDETFNIEILQNKSVLESVLEAGIDAPFSCQGGVCSTCIARIKDGSAIMAKNSILTDGEIAEGLTLTCQARPTSDTLSIDYDDV
ncbi:MAG: ferredoxin--NADP reductase [Flavobacteriaceae bacterium]|nr:ferredoxin--NADP reductase [Flavobacteriaceae bacterium]